MGIIKGVQDRLSDWFKSNDGQDVASLKKGEDLMVSGDLTGLSMGGQGMENLHNLLQIESDLMLRFADYEEMDNYPEIGSALDVYGNNATIPDSQHDGCIWPTSPDRNVREILADLFKNRISIEQDIYLLARTLTKYGNAYAEVMANENGVVGLNFLPPATVRRVETPSGTLLGFIQDPTGHFNITIADFPKLIEKSNSAERNAHAGDHIIAFEPWEMIHFRLRGKDMSTVYGHSILDNARWIWRRLSMAEDSALVYKLTRSPARFAFFVEVGSSPPKEAMAHVNKVKRKYNRKKILNPNNHSMDFRNNPLSPDEDFWIPMRDGRESTRIDVISGPDYQAVEDLKYYQSKLFSALKVPRAYLGADDGGRGGGGDSSSALAQQDVRFARTVMRIQREITNGIRDVCRLHLAVIGIDPDEIDFNIKMTAPSTIFSLARLELLSSKASVARDLSDYMPKEWIIQNLFELSKDDAINNIEKKNQEDEDEMESGGRGGMRFASVQDKDIRDIRKDISDLRSGYKSLMESTSYVQGSLNEVETLLRDMHRRSILREHKERSGS